MVHNEKGFACTGKSGPGFLAELRKRAEPDVQLPGHGDVPSPVDPSLAKNVTCDAMFEPFECVASAEFDVFVAGVCVGIDEHLRELKRPKLGIKKHGVTFVGRHGTKI